MDWKRSCERGQVRESSVKRAEVCAPRGSIYTAAIELGPKRPSLVLFWGPNSTMVVSIYGPWGTTCEGFLPSVSGAPRRPGQESHRPKPPCPCKHKLLVQAEV